MSAAVLPLTDRADLAASTAQEPAPAGTTQDRAVSLAEALDALPTITLGELLDAAALQTRVDRKYLVPSETAARLVAGLPGAAVLQIDGLREFRYESVYLDTPDLLSYAGTALRRRRRFKVRTRTYLDSDDAWLEVKTREARGRTVKTRLPIEPTQRDGLDERGRRFVDEVLPARGVALTPGDRLVPTLTSHYRRSTLYLPRCGARVTVDTALTWTDTDGTWLAPSGLVVVETKTATATPSDADRALWAMGHRPVRFSKYGTGMAALHPDLPASRWHRVLRRWTDLEERSARCAA